ncbi:MAG: M10 family metallopeptidase C-terminal domain-containing protein [Burkholderiales bacterium]|nr:M10 family metallopeptidase C-terminal domain-containing protein [Burkholderiales bacterium]
MVTGETRGVEVRATGTTTAFATFMERTGANDIGVAVSNWRYVFGSNTKAETVVLTDNEAGNTNDFSLAGGKNVVDYTAMSSTVTANIGTMARSGAAATATAFQPQISTVTGTGDTIYQALNQDNANNFLTIVGTGQSGDTINVAAFTLVAVAPGALGTSATVGTLSSVSGGALARHVVNLGAGTINEDIHGQFGNAAGAVTSANFLTMEQQFENATNAGDADRVTLIGSGGVNGLTGGTSADILLGGRGTTPVGSATTGDSLTGNAGADWFVYTDESESPFGSVTGNQQSNLIFGGGAAGDAAVLRSVDVIADFTTTVDKLVFTINADSWDVVKVTTAIPANLAAAVGSVTAETHTLAAGSAEVHLPVNGTAAFLYDRVQDFLITTTAATPVVGDLIFRVQMTSGGDVVDAALGNAGANLNAAAADGRVVHFVYTDKNQSQGGGFDQIINFTSGSDKIDLSFLRAPEWEARFGVTYDINANNVSDAIEGIRSLPAAPLAAFNSDAPGLFMEGGAHRAIAVQTLTDGFGDPSTTIFVDVNHDGDYTVGLDMVLSLVGRGAPVLGDFIFDNYDLLGLGNELPAFPANPVPGT